MIHAHSLCTGGRAAAFSSWDALDRAPVDAKMAARSHKTATDLDRRHEMEETFYVPFEPGIGADAVMTPRSVAARIVARAPGAAAVKMEAADAWFENPAIENINYIRTRRAADPPTRVAVMRDERFLLVAFECMEPEMEKVHRLVPRDAEKGQVEVIPGVMPRVLDYDENVAVYLDYRHDKNTYYVMRVNVNGARSEKHLETPMGWTVFPNSQWKEMEGLQWESEVAELQDRWRAAIRVELKSIGVECGKQPTVGFNVTRGRNVDCWRNDSWTDIVHVQHVPALAMGDLYLGDHGVVARRIDWGSRECGPNRVKLTVSGGTKDRDVMLKVEANDREGLRGADYHAESQSESVRLAADTEAVLEADFELPFDHPRMLITLEVTDAGSGEGLYRATFPLRDHGDVRVAKPYSRVAKRKPENPSPHDEQFHEKKLEWVLSRLSKFCRRTTAQGAPSDFTLTSRDGKVVFNLMETGALKKIADWICTLFEEDNDRLTAVALLTNDDWVTVHAGPRVGMQSHMTPLSLLRLGGGHCYSRAAVGAGIVNELPDPATGENHEAWPTLVLGHVITQIRRGDDYVFIDPSFGHFFYNRANTDFATAKELATDHELVTRVVKGEKRLANYMAPSAHVRLDEGTIVWPASAPPR